MKKGEILSGILTSVSIVTTEAEGRANGMTVGWLCQASFCPPMLVVSIAPERYTHGLLKKSGAFSVNVLRNGQIELARAFGLFSGRDRDKFEGVATRKGLTGAPILEGAASVFECELAATHRAGDHDLFVGKIVVKEIFSESDLLPFRISDYF